MRPSASQVTLFFAIILILTLPTFCFAAPSITSLSPTSGAVGASVTINGSGFGSTQGSSTVKFNGKVASVTSWSASAIIAVVPSGATTGNVVVTVSGVASNGKSFTVVAAPSITSLSPASGPVGQSITVAGSGFGSTQGSSTIKFNGTIAVPTSWSSTQIKAPVPAGATSGNVVVHASGVDSNGKSFTVLLTPSITSLEPASGQIGDSVTITGTNFGDTQGTSTVKFNGTTATPTNWTDTGIDVPVPSGATTGNVVVTVSGVASVGVSFTVIATPTISSLSPSSGAVGALVTINGTNFQPTQGDSTVSFNGTLAVPTTWTATQIKAPVPAGATSGNVVVTVFGLASNGKNFTVKLPPIISSLSQNLGSVGMTITINGANFGWSQGSSTLKFNGIASTPSLWTDTQITAPVPSGATTGPVIVHANGVDSNGSNFTVDTLTSIALGPQNLSLPLGSKQRYTATGTFSNGGQQSLGNNANWTSDNTYIGTVDPNGLFTAIGLGGPATIQASVGSLSSSASLNVTGSTFIQVDALPTGEGYYSTATLLPSGKVLIVGALPGLPNAFLYDPVTTTFSPTGSLQTGRGWHTATLLDNGKVLIAGGLTPSNTSVRTAELYDPESGTFSVIGYMNYSRFGHTATLLKNGQVLLAAGSYLLQVGVGGPAPAELYDPATGTFSLTGDLSVPRTDATATLLNDGTVLVVGGFAQNGSTAAVERYDVATGTFTRTADLGTPRGDHTATLLGNGKVLIVGGACTSCAQGTLTTAELYDPVAGTFTATGSLSLAREFHTATLLGDGTVLVVGGVDVSVTLSTAERFDPTTQTFTGAGSMINGRYGALATLLNDGTVLIAGGTGMTGDEIAELYAPTPPPPSSLQITPSNVTMIVGETRQFTVIDNNGHPRSDATWSLSDESLATITSDGSPTLTATAPGNLNLTASVQGTTAQAQIAIFEIGTVLDPGTPYWSVTSTPGFVPTQIAQAVPTEAGPDLYSVETSSDGKTTLLHALTADGRQLWQSQLPAVTSKSVPDGGGGLLVTEHATCDIGQTDPMTVADIDAKTGRPLWQVRAAGIQMGQNLIYCYSPDMAPQIAVQSDGAVVMSAPTNSGMPPLITVRGGSVGSTLIPDSSITDSGGHVTFVQSIVGPPTVSTDGAAYVEYQVRDTGIHGVNSAALYLLTPGATPILLMRNTDLNSGRFPEPTDSSLLPGRIIPDGQGGLIATWTILPSNLPSPRQPWHYYQAAHVVDGSVLATYDLPFTPLEPSQHKSPELVLGEDNTIFVSGFNSANDQSPIDRSQIASFDLNTGIPNWVYQVSDQSTMTIVAATEDGGVTAKTTQGGSDTIVQFNSSGIAAFNNYRVARSISNLVSSSATSSVATQGVTNIEYASGGWIGTSGNSVVSLNIDPLLTSFNPSPFVGGGPPKNGGSNEAIIYHFLPRDPGFGIEGPNGYKALVRNSIPDGPNGVTKLPVRNVFRVLSDATISRFITAVRSNAAAVAFIGDSAGFAEAGVPRRYGLIFFNQILASPTLPESARWPGYPLVRMSFSDMKPNTRVLFVAACDFDDTMSQWMTVYKNKQQAYIVPKVPDIPTFLGAASAAWMRMLLDLGDGLPVSTAVESGNRYLIDNPPNPLPENYVRPSWKPIGELNVTFKTSQ